ncbi:MAG: isocitrate lyase/phosphoenolpyruvate mutase family protein [Planctomycetaceae bacterium]|nr:isocitrate lyase/phosphoenolpyruvate mutase family protein [Planctomycetaceae bacterium]
MNDKAAKFRQLMARKEPIVIAGAHNGLSAKLVEEAGFDGIWASGFEISASFAIPDANILTMAENVTVAKAMNNSSTIPVVADCDNGFGNAINVIRTVQEYEAAGIAAICMEDNVFPKRCSFYVGVKRELSSVEEHAGKVRAAKDAQRSKDFVVIARTEALIAGWGMEEALKRANAYADAGADMCLIHSKSDKPDEVLEFAKRWKRKTPLVCVPTIYKEATVSQLYEGGYKMVIVANHGLRAAVKAMQGTLKTIREKGYVGAVEDRIVPLKEVYRLVGEPEMSANEKAYMPPDGEQITAIILAAGPERDMGALTEDKPRTMLDIKGKTILERQIEALNACNIKHIAVVRGYKKDAVAVPNVRYYENDDYDDSGELASLMAAKTELKGRVLVLYGDILFDRGILEKLLHSPGDITVVADRSWRDSTKRAGKKPDLIVEEDAPKASTHRYLTEDVPSTVTKIGSKIDAKKATSEFIGMLMLSPEGSAALVKAYDQLVGKSAGKPLHESKDLKHASLTDMLQELIAREAPVSSVGIYKGWMEVDTFEDYQRAWAEVKA